jgi:hypothetical protein
VRRQYEADSGAPARIDERGDLAAGETENVFHAAVGEDARNHIRVARQTVLL